MADGFGTSPFVLPNMFGSPGEALQQGLAMQERRNERKSQEDYRNQKDQEAEEWKKLGLIQELTNLDKYQTGEAAADAIGHQQSQSILQKYTAAAKKMTPAELQYKISQDIGKTTVGMQNMKDELKISDEKIKQYKKIYPSLNDAELTKIVRADVIGRRIKGGDFANPTDANQPSQLNLDDPDFISSFIDVNKGLRDAAVNPKNIQKNVNVLRGTEKSYVAYEGDLPYYMKEDFKTTGGFYNGKEEPTISLKTSTIPKGAFSGATSDIDVLDEGAFEVLLAESAEVEPSLRKLAKTKYKGNYSSMSNAEKEIAMRDVAKDFLKTYSENFKYRAKSATRPASSNVFNLLGSDFTGGGKTTGNELDKIKSQIKLPSEDYTGDWTATGGHIPSLTRAVLKTGGIEIDPSTEIRLIYNQGELQEIRSIDGVTKIVDRDEMEVAQKKYDAERKGEGQKFGVDKNKPTGRYPLPKGQERTRTQGGFTYTWNEKTGKYE